MVILSLLFFLALAAAEEDDPVVSSSEPFTVQGKVFPPDPEPDSWLALTHILLNGGEYRAFLREDGSFLVHNVTSGSYIVQVSNPDHVYEPARVEITSKGKIRARRVNYIQTAQVVQVTYPLKLHVRAPFRYFQIREQWRITDFLFSPMVLMMVLPLVLIMLLPKLMNAADPETQREMQQSLQMPKYDMPELSEMMTSLFTGGKKPQPKQVKPLKKRQ